MRQVAWQDKDGRTHFTLIPNGAPDADGKLGVPVGPPPLKALGLPKETEIRLHNELAHRGLLTYKDARRRQPDVLAALMAALKLDAQRVMEIYAAPEVDSS
jgi:hypothetical protein